MSSTKKKNNSIDSVYLEKGNDAILKLHHPPMKDQRH